jgi:hypothetical protein
MTLFFTASRMLCSQQYDTSLQAMGCRDASWYHMFLLISAVCARI